MKKIIIFKTDRIGDFVNFSPCLKILKDNFNECHITLVCSKYNYQIAKNYKEIDNFIIIKKSLFVDFFKLRKIFKLEYFDYLFQMDGNKNSYILSSAIKSKIKSSIFFYKYINFLIFKYKRIRPNYFLRKLFDNFEFCDEDYNNKLNTHYQKIYFKLMGNLDFNILHKKNIFYLDENSGKQFSSIFFDLPKNFLLMHIDDKSNRLNYKQRTMMLDFINKVKKTKNVIITFGLGNIELNKELEKILNIIDYNDRISPIKWDYSKNILGFRNLPLNLLAYFIAKSEANISMHSGSIVHISAALDKCIVDLLEKHKNDEVDRWIPVVSKYQRINFEDINENLIDNLF